MKPFTFSLEKVLKLRKYYEDEAKIELGKAVGLLAEIESKIVEVGKERARAASEQFAPGNSAVLVQHYMYYLLRLDSNTEELLKEAALAEIKVEAAREEFLRTSQERKVLDKLKEKRQKEYRKEKLADETKNLDDISSGSMSRQAVMA